MPGCMAAGCIRGPGASGRATRRVPSSGHRADIETVFHFRAVPLDTTISVVNVLPGLRDGQPQALNPADRPLGLRACTTAPQLVDRTRPVFSEQSRHRAVGEQTAARLATRAVVALVVGVH